MKKYIITLGCLILISTTSCQRDFFDTKPLDSYSNETLWQSKSDAMAALIGVYSGWEDGANIVYDDTMTDNGYNQFPWEGMETVASGNASPLDTGNSRWSFTTIQRANWFIDNIDKVPLSIDFDQSLKDRLKSEARFIRAYEYFILSQRYGDVPLVLHQLTPAEANSVTQSSKAEITEFIIKELTESAPLLPVSYTGADIGRITRGAALGLKARVQLFNSDWQGCIATCSALMQAPFTYSLYPDYSELFNPQNANNQEVMLDVQYQKNDYAMWALMPLAMKSQGGWSSIVPTQALVDAYETINGKPIDQDPTYDPYHPYKNRDPRLQATIVTPGAFYAGAYFNPYSGTDKMGDNNASPTGYNVRKYLEDPSIYKDGDYGVNIGQTGGNIIVMRYAEILLSYAEAKIEAGQTDASVYNAINKIRNRAGMPDVDQGIYNTQEKLRELIRRERRVELAMEGLRFYDIQRWKIGVEVLNSSVMSAPLGSVDTSTGELTITPGSNKEITQRHYSDPKNLLLPIPQKEIDLNDNLNQNPGY